MALSCYLMELMQIPFVGSAVKGLNFVVAQCCFGYFLVYFNRQESKNFFEPLSSGGFYLG